MSNSDVFTISLPPALWDGETCLNYLSKEEAVEAADEILLKAKCKDYVLEHNDNGCKIVNKEGGVLAEIFQR